LGATAATLSGILVGSAVRGGSAKPPRPLNEAPETETGDQERLGQLQPHVVLVTVPGLLEIPDMIGSAAEEAKLRVGALEPIDIPDDIASSVLRQMRTNYQSDKSMLRQWAQLLKARVRDAHREEDGRGQEAGHHRIVQGADADGLRECRCQVQGRGISPHG